MSGRWIARIAVATVIVLGVAGILGWRIEKAQNYHLDVVLPSAVGVYEGTPAQIDGQDVGEVTGVRAKDGKAVVTLSIAADRAPLRAGTAADVEWRSLLGEHFIALRPATADNPSLPSGAMIGVGSRQVTLEDLLEAFDGPTRQHLRSLLPGLARTLNGREQDLNETIKTAGPVTLATANVLDAVSRDGPALRSLITKLRDLTREVAGRHGELGSVVNDLGALTSSTVAKQQQLNAALGELPSTLDAAKGTLDKVPAAADAAIPLLKDLAPATKHLPSVARNLKPVLADLRPTVGELRPTLDAASTLLDSTPGLLDNLHSTVPGVTQAVRSLAPALKFLRPYTPDIVGFLGNWGNALGAAYDGQGHLSQPLVTSGETAIDNHPGILTPGMTASAKRAPGANAGQPWTDAAGSGPR